MTDNFSLTPGQRLSLINTFRWWFVAAHTLMIKTQSFKHCSEHDAEAVQITLGVDRILGVPGAFTNEKRWVRPVIVKRKGHMEDAILWAKPYKTNARRIWLSMPGGYVKRFRIVDCFVDDEKQQIFTKVLANGANTELQEQFKNDNTFWMQLKGKENAGSKEV